MKTRFFKFLAQQSCRDSRVEGALRKVCAELKSDPELMYKVSSKIDINRGSRLLDSLLEADATPSKQQRKVVFH